MVKTGLFKGRDLAETVCWWLTDGMTLSDEPIQAAPAAAKRQPPIHIAPVTLLIVLVLAAVHVMRLYILSPNDEQLFVLHVAFVPKFLHDVGFYTWQPWPTLLSYSLLHFGWLHFIVNITALTAFGSAVERMFGMRRYIVVLLSGIVAGALVHFAFYSNSTVLLGGISAGISALFAVVLGMMQLNRSDFQGWTSMRKPVIAWVIMNVAIGLMGVPGQPGLAIGWIAHLGGFAAGLLALAWLIPDYAFGNTHGKKHGTTQGNTHD